MIIIFPHPPPPFGGIPFGQNVSSCDLSHWVKAFQSLLFGFSKGLGAGSSASGEGSLTNTGKTVEG